MTRTASPSSLHDHPLAGIVPQMRPDEWADFYADVALRGIRVPLEVLGDGTVLDGRHRLRAALELGLTAIPIMDAPLKGDSPTAYMLRAAVIRRHLTDDQRAAMAALWKAQNKAPTGAAAHGKSARRRADLDDEHPTRAAAVELFNAPRRKIDVATSLLNSEPDLLQRVHSGDVRLAEAARTVRLGQYKRRIEELPALPGQFRTIVADPPWPYDDTATRGAAEDHYQTLTLTAIRDYKIAGQPVRDYAPDDGAHLYLWTPGLHLREGEALSVVRAWGFEPATMLTWVKPQMGIGKWFRSAAEHVLFCTRKGLPLTDYEKAYPNWFQAERREHSEKPERFYEIVQAVSPGPYLDLFGRRERPGWSLWGDETWGEV